MRLFIASDLHVGVDQAGDRSVAALAAYVCEHGREDDVLLIGGDIGTDDASITRCLDLFATFRGTKAAIAGNHDVWVVDHRNSLQRYLDLPQLFRQSGFHPLEEAPLKVGDVGFAGAMGWYDYSFADNIGLPIEQYIKKSAPFKGLHATWSDALHVKWGQDDRDVAGWQENRLASQLDQLQGMRETVVLVHHVPTKKLLFKPRCLVPRQWRFLNAFLGSEGLSKVVSERGANVQLVVNGHIHQPCQARKDGKQYIGIGGDYKGKQILIRENGAVRRLAF